MNGAGHRTRMRKAWEFSWDDDVPVYGGQASRVTPVAPAKPAPVRMRKAWEFSWDDDAPLVAANATETAVAASIAPEPPGAQASGNDVAAAVEKAAEADVSAVVPRRRKRSLAPMIEVAAETQTAPEASAAVVVAAEHPVAGVETPAVEASPSVAAEAVAEAAAPKRRGRRRRAVPQAVEQAASAAVVVAAELPVAGAETPTVEVLPSVAAEAVAEAATPKRRGRRRRAVPQAVEQATAVALEAPAVLGLRELARRLREVEPAVESVAPSEASIEAREPSGPPSIEAIASAQAEATVAEDAAAAALPASPEGVGVPAVSAQAVPAAAEAAIEPAAVSLEADDVGLARARLDALAAEAGVEASGEGVEAKERGADDISDVDVTAVLSRLRALGGDSVEESAPASKVPERRVEWVKPRRFGQPVQVVRVSSPAVKRSAEGSDPAASASVDGELRKDPLVARAVEIARLLRDPVVEERHLGELRRMLREMRDAFAGVEARVFARRGPKDPPAFFQAYDPRTRTA